MLAFYTLVINSPIPSLTSVIVVLALPHGSGWNGLVRFPRDWHWPLCTHPLVICMSSWENFARLWGCVICLFLRCESIHYVLYILNILLEKEILSRLTGNCDSVWVWSAWKCLCYFVYTFLTKQWKTFTVWTLWLWVVQWSFETLLVTKLICQTHSPFFPCLSLDSTKPRFLVQLLLSGNQQRVVVEAQKSGRWRQDSVFCSSKSWSPYVSIGSLSLLVKQWPS